MLKQISFITLLSLSALSIFGQNKKPSAPRSLDLLDALQQKIITATVEGLGGHQGECLKITCSNLQSRTVYIRIPSGQYMQPADSTQQRLVVAVEQTLVIGAKKKTDALLRTFCTQMGNRSPVSGSVFSVGALAPATLVSLLQSIVEKGKEETADAQTAVWAVSNGQPLAGIGDAELTSRTAQLLNRPVPTYRITYKRVEHVPGQRAELGEALVVDGNYTYTMAQKAKVVTVLLDSTGKQIKQLGRVEDMEAGEHRGKLHLEVFGLPKGKYTVRMRTQAGVAVKDIEVEF